MWDNGDVMKRWNYIFFSAVLSLFVSCSATEICTIVPDSDSGNYGLYDHYVDEFGNEGVVAYAVKDEYGATVIVLSLDETECAWGRTNYSVYPVVEGFNPGYLNDTYWGLEMNQLVERLDGEDYPSFAWCHAKNKDGKPLHSSSWILPSYSEFMWITYSEDNAHLNALNKAIETYGGTPLSIDEFYWTATEDIDDYIHLSSDTYEVLYGYDQDNRALRVTPEGYFYTNKANWSKRFISRVRAVKYIYYEYVSVSD